MILALYLKKDGDRSSDLEAQWHPRKPIALAISIFHNELLFTCYFACRHRNNVRRVTGLATLLSKVIHNIFRQLLSANQWGARFVDCLIETNYHFALCFLCDAEQHFLFMTKWNLRNSIRIIHPLTQPLTGSRGKQRAEFIRSLLTQQNEPKYSS